MTVLTNGAVPAQKNGKTVVNNNTAATPPKAPAAEEKPKETPPAAKVEKLEQLPLEDRILKIQILGDLIAKRDKLQETLKKVSSFKFSSENRMDKLTIEDGEDNEFMTTNTDVLLEVVATIKATIIRKIADVDAQIIF